ncbi:MAG: hypothetical protein WBN39_07615, partial [Flavobacteriaceae bacterium]
HSLHPVIAIPGALAFMVICAYSALKYETHKEYLKSVLNTRLKTTLVTMELMTVSLIDNARVLIFKMLRSFGLVKG